MQRSGIERPLEGLCRCAICVQKNESKWKENVDKWRVGDDKKKEKKKEEEEQEEEEEDDHNDHKTNETNQEKGADIVQNDFNKEI